MKQAIVIVLSAGSFGLAAGTACAADVFPKPYSPPCVERENVFEFTEKPKVTVLGNDKYEITFAVKGNCDVTVGLVDAEGKVVRHLGAGVLGANAPAPFQKNSMKQTIYWNGKDDLDWYHKEPGKLRVRVALGLKPTFDKLLGSAHPKNAPGHVWGIALNQQGAYVFWRGDLSRCNLILRQYDRDGNYVRTVYPPSNQVPHDQLAGMSVIEYEQGRFALHGPDLNESLMKGIMHPAASKLVASCQPAIADGYIYFTNFTAVPSAGIPFSKLYRIRVDDERRTPFIAQRDLCSLQHEEPSLAASPDGRYIYASRIHWGGDLTHTVYRVNLDDAKPAKPFINNGPVTHSMHSGTGKPGSGNEELNDPQGLDCDAAGRIYVAGRNNNRVQIFAADGKHQKTLNVDRPAIVRVHQRDGSLYVVHQARVAGKSIFRLTKFGAFPDLQKIYHNDEAAPAVMAVDSWSPKTRLWMGQELAKKEQYGYGGARLRVWEEDGTTLRKIVDHDAEALREEGGEKLFYWDANGAMNSRVVCNPLTEKAYYKHVIDSEYKIFDLASGKIVGRERLCYSDDIAFDKRGYLHSHLGPSSIVGVARYDPGQPQPNYRTGLKEVPYDYGEEAVVMQGEQRMIEFRGLLPVKDQPGAHGFQDGVGVNMRGDVAIETSIYNAPKMGELSINTAWAGMVHELATGTEQSEGGRDTRYAKYKRDLADIERRGLEQYFIRRTPGIRLTGGTVWTFDRTGEVRQECAFGVSAAIHGVQLDEDGEVYCVITDRSLRDGKPFLAGRGSTLGRKENIVTPHTGTLVKTRNGGGQILFETTPVPMDATEFPQRPPDVETPPYCDGRGWVEGVSWLYAGASPIVHQGMCYCPTQRLHLDWFKRVYVPEGYRHSIGILDTAGNVILHLGRYGNWDDAVRMKPGDTDMVNTQVRFIGGTDNYLCFQDWGERLQAWKLNYHAEETVEIGRK